MGQMVNYLKEITGDVFKRLPMKEDELNGIDNHLSEYLDSVIVNLKGSIITYPELANDKNYLYVINNLNFISNHDVDFWKWRSVILNSTKGLSNLRDFYKGE